MEKTISVEQYKSALDAMHEVCESFKQDRNDARQLAEQYKEWWLQETSKTAKLSADLEKAVEYSNELEDENMALNNHLMYMLDGDDESYGYEDEEEVEDENQESSSMDFYSNVLDSMLNEMMGPTAKAGQLVAEEE